MADLINSILLMFVFAIFIRSILTWFPIGRDNPIQLIVFQVTEPVLGPIRRYLPRFGAMDLAPMVVIIVILWGIRPLVTKVLP
ncbi:MAG: YggT family protein [Chloroflexi bacterium]|nr:YggT family protein [Chloroflexota bacterium]